MKINPFRIIELVSEVSGVSAEALTSKGRSDGNLLVLRYTSMKLIKDLFPGINDRELSKIFNKDRSTMNHWRYNLTHLENDSLFYSIYKKVRNMFNDSINEVSPIEIEIKKSIFNLIYHGNKISPGTWQSKEVNVKMVELLQVYLRFQVPAGIKELREQCKPDLPWADDHFMERIGRQPLNPGDQYFNWPYYQPGTFLEVDNKMFSHTYMERFWPKHAGDPKLRDFCMDEEGSSSNKGIRYEYGDYNDIVQQLKENGYTRQAFLSIWHPEDQLNNKVRKPCTIGYHFQIRDGYMYMSYLIRSCDAIRHFRNDIYMACKLLYHTIKSVDPDLKPGIADVWIGNFHCFESDLYTLKKQLR